MDGPRREGKREKGKGKRGGYFWLTRTKKKKKNRERGGGEERARNNRERAGVKGASLKWDIRSFDGFYFESTKSLSPISDRRTCCSRIGRP